MIEVRNRFHADSAIIFLFMESIPYMNKSSDQENPEK